MTLRRVLPLSATAVLALGLALGAAGCDDTGSDAPTSLDGVVRTPPRNVSSVTLPDETPGADGAPFSMKAAPGELLLAYFGYTNCPDVCPTTLSDIGVALRKLPRSERDRVDLAFVTVDPARDSGEKLASYLDHFVARGHALRTTDAALQQSAQDAFGVVARQIPEGTSYSMEHTAVTYVIDDTGRVVVEWPFGTQPAAMADDLRYLFDRGEP